MSNTHDDTGIRAEFGTPILAMRRPAIRALCVAGATMFLASANLAAQHQTPLPGGDGFLFGRPRGTATFRVGFAQPTAQSDVFRHTSKFLTAGRGSFRGVAYGAELAMRMNDRLDFQFGAAYSARNVGSEFRDYIDNADDAIEQHTSFERAPITMGLKYYLTAPGQNAGDYVWVPERFAPYVSGGGGWVWYRFKQYGDFVDFQSLDIFRTSLFSSSWTPTAYGATGMETSIRKDTSLLTELRFDFARGRMGRDFYGFNRIDLSGVSLTAGLIFRF